MSFPNVLKSIYTMKNSDINFVGRHLGYDWNHVCEQISRAGFYAEDGDGAFTIERDDDENDYSSNEVINKIFIEIFKNYPHVNEIQVVN